MPLVLLPSDQRDWVTNFAAGYRQLGWDVVTGTLNFNLEACHPDVMHVNWPEELTGWHVPNAAQIDAMIARLDRWAKRVQIIASVNNLEPHGQAGNPLWSRLYTALYERADVIHHFSHASKEAICRKYPSVASRNHVVRLGFNYERLLPSTVRNRTEARRSFGIQRDEMAYLCFGSLRSWEEVCLIRNAFGRARVPRKRLVMAARYLEPGSRWPIRFRRLRWRLWQRRSKIIRITEYVPDADVYRLFDAADAVVVVRNKSLTSGVPCLAMTFGRFVIAPDFGAMPEYVGGAENLLYDQTSPRSLADAFERAVHVDREAIGAQNGSIAADWTWQKIIRACLDALPKKA